MASALETALSNQRIASCICGYVPAVQLLHLERTSTAVKTAVQNYLRTSLATRQALYFSSIPPRRQWEIKTRTRVIASADPAILSGAYPSDMVIKSEEESFELMAPYVINPFLGQRVADNILDQFKPGEGGFRLLVDLNTIDCSSSDSRLYMQLTQPACQTVNLAYKTNNYPDGPRYVNLRNVQGAGVEGVSLRDLVTWKAVHPFGGLAYNFAVTEIVVSVPGGVLVTEEEMARVQREGGVRFRREE
ncbi:hypothetical protein LTR37_001598 [Vermiconidia calcicola]|uniref:Uncharacterized protein n=1 Tax=Vermiconidia calcicola TaxID=1690605 RepID=A0ACC3NW75_9PEZI|nr:hypothetical protein LTR37_001598 [Vermiconidia calcicola]